MEKIVNNYFKISLEKEYNDTLKLVEIIKNEGWVDNNTVIVTCSPDYSSRLSMEVNHRLSHLNKNELYEQTILEMPYPNTTQIYNSQTHDYQLFDTYLFEWIKQQVYPSYKYLFIDSGTIRGKNFNKVKLCIRKELEPENYRFASLYMEKQSIFVPDYLVEIYDHTTQGGLLFHWENIDNPNWNY